MKSNYTEKKDTDSPIHVEYVRNPGKGVAVKMAVDKDRVFANPDFQKICDTITAENLSHSIAEWVSENHRMPEGFEDADSMIKAGIERAKKDIMECVEEAAVKYLYLHVFNKDNMHGVFQRAKKTMIHILKLQQEGE